MTSTQYKDDKLKFIVLEESAVPTAGTISFSIGLPSERGSNGRDE